MEQKRHKKHEYDQWRLLPTYSYIASDEFIKGLLSGYYRNCEYIDSGSIICKVNNELLLHSISFLLNYFGIIGIYVKKEDLFILEVNKNYTKTLEIDVLEEISPYFPKIGVQTCVHQKQKIYFRKPLYFFLSPGKLLHRF